MEQIARVRPVFQATLENYTALPRTPQTKARKASARPYVPYLIFTLCASMYLLPFMRVLTMGANEGVLIERAVRIVHGQVFARDFAELMGPGSIYWLAFFFKMFGVNFFVSRVCVFVTSLATAFLMYFLSRRLCRKYQVLPCLLFFSTSFFAFWPEINPHSDANLLALLAFTCMILWHDLRKGSLLAAAGFLAGMSTLCLLPKGVLLVGAIGMGLCVQWLRRTAPLSSVALVASGYVSAIGLAMIYFWSRGALHDVIFNNILWPFRHYAAENTVPYAYGLLLDWTRWMVPIHGVRWLAPLALVTVISFLFIAALPALTLVFGIPKGKANLRPDVLLYWLCGWAVWLSEIHRRDIGHLVSGSPLLLILCIYFLAEFRGRLVGLTLRALAFSAGSLALANLLLVLTAHAVVTRAGTVALFKQDPVLSFLDTHAMAGTAILAYPYCPTYYFLSGTVNPTRFGAFVYGFTPLSVYREVIRDLDQQKVKYVVWDTNFETKQVRILFPSVPDVSRQSYILEPYLESHYHVVRDFNGMRIMERKPEGPSGE